MKSLTSSDLINAASHLIPINENASSRIFSNLPNEFSLNGSLKVKSFLVEINGQNLKDLSQNYISFMKDIVYPKDFISHKREFQKILKYYGDSGSCTEDEVFYSCMFKIKWSENDWLKVVFNAIYLFPLKIFGIFHHIISIKESESNFKLNISKREIEVLKLIAKGDSAKIIGDKLHISENTVVSHRKHLKQKLKVKNTAELVREAIFAGIVI